MAIRHHHSLLAIAALLGPAALAAGEHVVIARRAPSPPVIDGVLGGQEWAGAARLGNFLQLEPKRGEPETQRTEAFLYYDDTHIYIGVYAYDTEPDKITARLTARDDDLASDDAVVVLLDTFHDRRTCYYFAANPLATQADGRVRDDGRVEDKTWDAEWDVAARVLAGGWSAEFAIPLRVLQFQRGDNRTWGLNIGRTRRANLETTLWAGPLEAPFRVSQYGEIRGLSLAGGGAKRWEFLPYVQGQYEQGRTLKGNAGFDFRYTFRPESMASLTLNPDFAIIEADEEFVNLTRYEVRLEEKRPFFLESNNRFQQRIQTFYSRRIGDIDVGGNLISRYGPWDLTLLSVRSAPIRTGTPFAENANYTVGRADWQILRSSNVAFMAANRYLNGTSSGSVSADTTLHFTRTVNFTGQVVRSHGAFDQGRWAYFVRPSWDRQTSHVHLRYSHVGERFGDNVNAIGFIPDDDRREFDSDLIKTFWIEKGALQRVHLESRNNIFWSQRDVLRSYHNIGTAQVEFRNRWSAAATYRNDFKLFEKGFHNDQAEFTAGYNTREYNSWQVGYLTGKNFEANLDAISARVRRKLTRGLATEYQLSRVWLKPDPENKATFINVFRVRQNFTRDLFLRAFFQTNSVIDRKNLELVFVWRYKPPFGSIQFAFQRGRAAFGARSDQGNTFFLKIQHVL